MQSFLSISRGFVSGSLQIPKPKDMESWTHCTLWDIQEVVNTQTGDLQLNSWLCLGSWEMRRCMLVSLSPTSGSQRQVAFPSCTWSLGSESDRCSLVQPRCPLPGRGTDRTPLWDRPPSEPLSPTPLPSAAATCVSMTDQSVPFSPPAPIGSTEDSQPDSPPTHSFPP